MRGARRNDRPRPGRTLVDGFQLAVEVKSDRQEVRVGVARFAKVVPPYYSGVRDMARNRILGLAVLLTLTAVLVGASPSVRELTERVEALESAVEDAVRRVGLLEEDSGSVGDLVVRVDDLEVESDRQPVVIDANGVEVGTTVGISSWERGQEFYPVVLLHLEGLPLLAFHVFTDRLSGDVDRIYFQSDNCTGQPFLKLDANGSDTSALRSSAFVLRGNPNPGDVYVVDLSTTTDQVVALNSVLPETTGCNPTSLSQTRAYPAELAFSWRDLFTPPFEVVIRGDAAW